MNRYLEKVAVHLDLYEDPRTKKKKWVVKGNPPPIGHVKIKSTYKRKMPNGPKARS